MYTSRARPRRRSRARRVRELEDARPAGRRLPERQGLPRRRGGRTCPGDVAGRGRVLGRRGKRDDRRPGQPRRAAARGARPQVDPGLSTLSGPAALRGSEPGQIREEAALRIPRRCRGFSRSNVGATSPVWGRSDGLPRANVSRAAVGRVRGVPQPRGRELNCRFSSRKGCLSGRGPLFSLRQDDRGGGRATIDPHPRRKSAGSKFGRALVRGVLAPDQPESTRRSGGRRRPAGRPDRPSV